MCYAPVPSIESLSHICHQINRHWPTATVLNVTQPLDVYDSRFAAQPIAIPLPLDKSRETEMKTRVDALNNGQKWQVAGWTNGLLKIALIASSGQCGLTKRVCSRYRDEVEAEIRLRADHKEHTVSDTLLKRFGGSAYSNIGGIVKLQICMINDKIMHVDCRVVKDVNERPGIWGIFARPQGYLTLAWYVVQNEDRTSTPQACENCDISRTELETS